MSFVADLFNVAGKRALVTGGTSGIGAMIAEGLVRAGVEVTVCSRRQEGVDATVTRLSEFGSCRGIAADIAKVEGVAKVVEDLRAHADGLDILVNNAGISWGAEFEQHSRAVFEKVMALNVSALFDLTRDLSPLLRAASKPGDPARVINISSVGAFETPQLEAYGYSASKAAVVHLTRHLAWKLAPEVLVNCVAPGLFESRMSAHMFDPAHPLHDTRPQVPLGRPGSMEDIAGAVIYLCSRAGAWVTGDTLRVSGGMTTID
jgi:NAD(P)-dependent dehydrogenase (short-subunit alcohol dehydrogenase family)